MLNPGQGDDGILPFEEFIQDTGPGVMQGRVQEHHLMVKIYRNTGNTNSQNKNQKN